MTDLDAAAAAAALRLHAAALRAEGLPLSAAQTEALADRMLGSVAA